MLGGLQADALQMVDDEALYTIATVTAMLAVMSGDVWAGFFGRQL